MLDRETWGAVCSPRVHKELDTTEQLNWAEPVESQTQHSHQTNNSQLLDSRLPKEGRHWACTKYLAESILWIVSQATSSSCLPYFFLHAQLQSRACLFATPWTVAHQAPLSFGFSWQEYWWVASSSSRGWSRPRDRTLISCICRQMLYNWATINMN